MGVEASLAGVAAGLAVSDFSVLLLSLPLSLPASEDFLWSEDSLFPLSLSFPPELLFP